MNEDRQRLLTSTEAAEYLGASATSIKRWADEGLLPCVRTAGKHRRFNADMLDRFARDHMGAQLEAQSPQDLDEWQADLLEGRPYRLQARLFDARAALPSWRAVARRVNRVIDYLAEARAKGTMTVIEEDLASQRLSRALARVAETLPVGPAAPQALIATLEGEDQTLGASLFEICLRELGWQALWTGRPTPLAGLGEALDRQQIRLLAVAASGAEPEALGRSAETLALLCRPRSITLWLTGRGAWPERPPYGRVLRELEDLPGAIPTV